MQRETCYGKKMFECFEEYFEDQYIGAAFAKGYSLYSDQKKKKK